MAHIWAAADPAILDVLLRRPRRQVDGQDDLLAARVTDVTGLVLHPLSWPTEAGRTLPVLPGPCMEGRFWRQASVCLQHLAIPGLYTQPKQAECLWAPGQEQGEQRQERSIFQRQPWPISFDTLQSGVTRRHETRGATSRKELSRSL
jgi:hypothetical protein